MKAALPFSLWESRSPSSGEGFNLEIIAISEVEVGPPLA